MDTLTDGERALIEQSVRFVGHDEDDDHKWAVLKIGSDDIKRLKRAADRFKHRPGERFDHAGMVKMLLHLPAEDVTVSVPKDATKVEVMDKWVRFKDTGLSGPELYGRLRVLAMARCSAKQAEKCKRCEEDGCHPFEGCLIVPGQKHWGCVTCLKLYYENGQDEKYDCSFENSE